MKTQRHIELADKIVEFETFSEILHDTCQRIPKDVFLVENEKVWTFESFNRLVSQCCYYFEMLGLNPGDIISIVLRNSIDYLILYFAAIRYRLVLNPCPVHLSSDEILSKIENVLPKIVFCHKEHNGGLVNSYRNVINLDDTDEEDFVSALDNSSDTQFPYRSIEKNQTAILYYSSGTVGNPKIIEYTHHSMVASQASMIRSGFSRIGGVHSCILPLGHTASLRYTIKQCVCTGSKVILYPSFWKLRSSLWNEIEKHKVTFLETVPSILISILKTKYKDFRKEQTNSLDFIGCGSSFLPQEIQNSFEKRFGVPVANLYGLSETGATHFDNPLDPMRISGSIGKPFDIVDVKIFNKEKQEAKAGELGEFGIKGPGLFKGYYKNQGLFQSSFNQGYYMTGDLGYKDENDVHYFVDRKKDLIIKGGTNIVPSEIEEVMLTHPELVEVAIVGKPDVLMGETIKAFIVIRNENEVSKDELKKFCKQKLGNFKTPSEFEFVKELPKGHSGKILKRQLR